LVQVDDEVFVITNNLKLEDVSFLLLVKPHCEDEGALCVSLSPLLKLSIVKRKANDTLSHLTHDIDPEKLVDLFCLEAEEFVDKWECGKVETAGISSAFFKTCRDGTKLGVPSLTSFITALICLLGNWISVGLLATVCITIVKFTNTMAEQLMACDMDFV